MYRLIGLRTASDQHMLEAVALLVCPGLVYTALGALLEPTNNLLRRVLPLVMEATYYPLLIS